MRKRLHIKSIIGMLFLICSIFVIMPTENVNAWVTDTLYTVYTGGYFEGTNNQSGAINMYVTTITLRTNTTRVKVRYKDQYGKESCKYYAASEEVAESGDTVCTSSLYTVYPDGGRLILEEVSGAVSIGWPNYDGMECSYEEGTTGSNPNDEETTESDSSREAAALLEQLNLEGLFSNAGMVLYAAKSVNSLIGEDAGTINAIQYLNGLFNNNFGVQEQNLPLMLDYKVTDNGNIRFRIVFPKGGDDDDTSALEQLFSSDESWDNYKNMVNYLNTKMEQTKKAEEELKESISKNGAMGLVKQKIDKELDADFALTVGGTSIIKGSQTLIDFIKPKLSVAGYLEIITDTEFHILSGEGQVIGKAESDNKPVIKQYLSPVGSILIPYYWKLGADYEGKIQLDYSMKYNEISKKNVGSKNGEISGNGRLLGQVGLGLVGIANVNGNLDINFNVEMCPKEYMKVNGKFWMGAKFLNYYKEAFFEPLTFNNTLWEDKKFDLNKTMRKYYADNPTLSVQSYDFKNAGVWNDMGAGESAIAENENYAVTENEEYTVVGNNVKGELLQDGTMPDSRPRIVTVGDKQVMIYLTMKESGSANAGRLLYSVKQDGVWSEPKAVWDNGKTDYYADMKLVDDTLYLTWQKAGNPVSGKSVEEQLNNAIAGSEICFAMFDEDTESFVGQTYVTNNNYADILPQIVAESNHPAIAWIQNKQNAIDGIADANVIRYSVLTEDTWSEPKTIATVEGMIGNYSAYVTSGQYNAVYSVIDMKGLTADDQPKTALYVTDSDGDKKIEEPQSSIIGVKYAKGAVYWLDAEGRFKRMTTSNRKVTTLVSKDDADEAVGADFTVVSNEDRTAVISSAATLDGYELRAALVQNGKLTNSYQMYLHENANMFSYDVAIASDGSYDIIVDDEFEHETEHNGIAEVIKEVSDTLEVDGIYMNDLNRDANNNQSLKLLVTNAGETPINALYVKVASGNIIYLNNEKIRETINAGESVEISTSFKAIKIQQPTSFKVSVYAEGQSEKDAWVYTTELGYTDVEIAANKQINADRQRIQYIVTNNSDSITSGVVKIYDDLSMENLVAELPFNSLEKGKKNYLYYDIDKDRLEFSEDGVISYQAVLEAEVHDSKPTNNKVAVAVYESDFAKDDSNLGDTNQETGEVKESTGAGDSPETSGVKESTGAGDNPETSGVKESTGAGDNPETSGDENNTGAIENSETGNDIEKPTNLTPEKPVISLPSKNITSFRKGKANYKVVSSKASNPTVIYLKPTNKNVKTVSIPATVKHNDITYKVIAVFANAFKGNKKLKKVTIGTNVKSIGKNAFNGCKKLKKITIKSAKLKTVGKNAIKGINAKARIKVPKKQHSTYRKLFKVKTGFKKTMKMTK